MDKKELIKKSESELQKILKENREKLRELRFALASAKVKNVREIPQLKKDIARILTILKIKSKSAKINF
jgi:large subunit ribosomal protein L29